eukprot:381303_1
MGNSKSKAIRNHKCTCMKETYNNDNHCCLLHCFSRINQYQKMDHLYWSIPLTIQTPLYNALKTFNAEFLTKIIISYLPALGEYKKQTNMPKKSKYSKQNKFNIVNNEYVTSCNVYMHANISWLFNKTKPPCKIWCHGIPGFKLVIMGSGGVGKSSLVIRSCSDDWVEEYDPTISDSYRKQYVVNPNKINMDDERGSNSSKYKSQSVLFDYLDCAGQEEFTALTDCWIREGEIFFLCFAINDINSFENVKTLRNKIYKLRENECNGHIQPFGIILVACKCDLINERKISINDGLELAKKWNIAYFETSSKQNINVHFMFRQSVYEYWVQNQTYD